MTNDTSGIYFTCKRTDYSPRNHMAVSRDCAWVYTLLPNLNKMEFIYLNSIPVSTSVIRSLSIWKIINERTAISSTLVLPAWVPGNWQVMWIFHTNYLLQYFLLNAHLPLLLFRSSSPWHLVGFHGFLYGLPFIFMSSSINSTFFFFWEFPRCPFYVTY